jgi:hypothetical protein
MGILLSLAFVIIPLLKRPSEPPADPRDAEIEALKRELKAERANTAGWERLAHRWRARYEQAISPVLEREVAAQIRHQIMLNQAMAQSSALQAQNLQAYVGLGAQQSLQGFCNCVPGRQDALLGGVNHA